MTIHSFLPHSSFPYDINITKVSQTAQLYPSQLRQYKRSKNILGINCCETNFDNIEYL